MLRLNWSSEGLCLLCHFKVQWLWFITIEGALESPDLSKLHAGDMENSKYTPHV